MDSSGRKPLDVGSGAACASFDPDSASWLSLGGPHPDAGFVELSGMPPFDEGERGDPEATRAWRHAMTSPAHAFLTVEIDGVVPVLAPDHSDPATAAWTGDGVEVRAWAPADAPAVQQRWQLRPTVSNRTIRLRLGGSLDRPALAEITEVDPPAPTGAATRMEVDGHVARLTADGIGAVAWIRLEGPDARWVAADAALTTELVVPSAAGIEIEIRAGLGEDVGKPSARPAARPSVDRLTDRALAYVRGCTALRVGPDERAFLTDHRILPLSWTRDGYWQALALLAADDAGDRDRVAAHLRWLWRRCERPDGAWVRSHHANGRRKDLAFQADQQLYPLIELADYWRLTGDLPDGVAWADAVPIAWAAAVERIDPSLGLISSTETAADDPAGAPFIAAAQVLLWYAADRLAELAAERPIGLAPTEMAALATDVRSAFDRHHAREDGPWAYAVGGNGHRVDYHDANDLPIALAPTWGFCTANDPGWSATMRFAFSNANPGWFAGSRAGLGSVHTPGPWPLGDVQAWIAARTLGDESDATAALTRLEEVAFDDGMLPEAYGAEDDTRIRAWFAWPGAVLAALRMLDRDGRLEPMLRARRG